MERLEASVDTPNTFIPTFEESGLCHRHVVFKVSRGLDTGRQI